MKKSRKSRTAGSKYLFWLVPLIIIAAFLAVFIIYTQNYYHADPSAVAAMQSDEEVLVIKTGYGWLFDGPSDRDGLVFYPGGKVEAAAYAPILRALAGRGIDVCLVRMPFRLAVFDSNAAETILQQYDYEHWYIGGHSLGGAMAASYVSNHPEDFQGVILLAAYPTKELPSDITEILVVGTGDQVVNRDKLTAGQRYAPSDYLYFEIEGGNHAQFGNYGLQKGDGEAAITDEEQQKKAVDLIINKLLNSRDSR